MVNVTFTETFERAFRKLKDPQVKQSTIKQIEKIIANPTLGKPLRYRLKGERTIYIKPYRLIYTTRKDEIILLRFQHRKQVYK